QRQDQVRSSRNMNESAPRPVGAANALSAPGWRPPPSNGCCLHPVHEYSTPSDPTRNNRLPQKRQPFRCEIAPDRPFPAKHGVSVSLQPVPCQLDPISGTHGGHASHV